MALGVLIMEWGNAGCGRTWDEWGVESLSVRAAPAVLVTGARMHPFRAPSSSQSCVGAIPQEGPQGTF